MSQSGRSSDNASEGSGESVFLYKCRICKDDQEYTAAERDVHRRQHQLERSQRKGRSANFPTASTTVSTIFHAAAQNEKTPGTSSSKVGGGNNKRGPTKSPVRASKRPKKVVDKEKEERRALNKTKSVKNYDKKVVHQRNNGS